MQPTPITPNVKQVPLLTASQIAQFKRDGFLVLPAVLDPELCRRARDAMWDEIATHLPRMKRDDPSTWGPLTEERKRRAKSAAARGRRRSLFRRQRPPLLRPQRR